MLKEFIKWAENNNWNMILSTEKLNFPDSIMNRYQLPEQWLNFIKCFSVCENESATKWFLTPNDYQMKGNGFQWNEFELQSLASTEEKSQIISYWNAHIPIILSVDGEYSYYAVNTENGNVVFGTEPEYEEAEVIANDFDTFIRKIISGERLL